MTQQLPREKPASGSYTVVDRVTKVRCSATSLEGLINRVGQVRAAVGAVSGLDLRNEVERWLCEDSPDSCTETDLSIPRLTGLTLTDVIRGSTVMISKLVNNVQPVPQDEAIQRGSVCRNCKYNQKFPLPCTGVCGFLKDMAIRLSGNQGTEHDRYLHSCAVCHCFLQAAIWLPLDVQCSVVTDDMKKQFRYVKDKEKIPCWKICT